MSKPEVSTPPPFSFDVDVQPGATVVHCAGRLMIESANTFRGEVQKLIKPGAHIILDLTHVTHCDSSGLGAIISLYVSSKSAGCMFELVNFGQTLRKLFSMTNLLSLFEAAADRNCRIP